MKKGLVIGLAAALVLGLTVGIASATVIQSNFVNTNGVVTINQFASAPDVVFTNALRVGTGILNFNQGISSTYGNFTNNVRLNSGDWYGDLRIDNFATEQYIGWTWVAGTGWVVPHREIGFNQNVYMGESNWNWDAATSRQTFSSMPGYIQQEVIVHPLPVAPEQVEPDTLDLWGTDFQGGVLNSTPLQPAVGGRAMLQQTGRASADYVFAGQYSNIGGVITGTILQIGYTGWTNFTQIIQYN